jgi:hypothetical protein
MRPTKKGPATAQHRADGHLRARPPAFAHTAAELQQHVDRLGAERVATILGLTLDHLGPLLAGWVKPIKANLRRLWGPSRPSDGGRLARAMFQFRRVFRGRRMRR